MANAKKGTMPRIVSFHLRMFWHFSLVLIFARARAISRSRAAFALLPFRLLTSSSFAFYISPHMKLSSFHIYANESRIGGTLTISQWQKMWQRRRRRRRRRTFSWFGEHVNATEKRNNCYRCECKMRLRMANGKEEATWKWFFIQAFDQRESKWNDMEETVVAESLFSTIYLCELKIASNSLDASADHLVIII